MRHAFRVLEELGAECDRLGVRTVDEHGTSGPASEFLAQIIHYIKARERECDRPRLTDEERESLEWAARMVDSVNRGDPARAATLRGLLERTGRT